MSKHKQTKHYDELENAQIVQTPAEAEKFYYVNEFDFFWFDNQFTMHSFYDFTCLTFIESADIKEHIYLSVDQLAAAIC